MIFSNNEKYGWLALAVINIIFIGGIVLFKIYAFDEYDNKNVTIRLDNIQQQLIQLQKAIKKPADKIDLSSINQDFSKLAGLIEQLKSKDESQLNQLMIENRTELTQKLNAIHEVINSLNKAQHPIKYLPETALPFKLLSIDSIQQISVASVTYDFKTVPMEKGDSLAGWTVMQIDFGKQSIELENMTKERVAITIKGDENV